MNDESFIKLGGAAGKLNKAKNPRDVTTEEWKSVLDPLTYNVTRESGTEKAFTGKYDKHFEPGEYSCHCCGASLFISDAKYSSGCGWPAFSRSVYTDANIVRLTDASHAMIRTEVRCKQCDAHLGHVFNDTHSVSGERYCINSCAVDFTEK